MANVPLLLLPLAIYNILFILIGHPVEAEAFRLPLMAGEQWVVRAGDLLISGSIVLLVGEVIRNSRASGRPMMAHLLSLMVLAGAICEFVLWPKAFGNSVFFIVILLMAADFIGGIAQRTRRTVAPAPHRAPAPVEPQSGPLPVQHSAPQGTTGDRAAGSHYMEPQISTGLAGSEGATIAIGEIVGTEPSAPA